MGLNRAWGKGLRGGEEKIRFTANESNIFFSTNPWLLCVSIEMLPRGKSRAVGQFAPSKFKEKEKKEQKMYESRAAAAAQFSGRKMQGVVLFFQPSLSLFLGVASIFHDLQRFPRKHQISGGH